MSNHKVSAGILLFRIRGEKIEVLVAHMGGPFWSSKDDGARSIVKGEYEDGEEPFAAACREFEEETGAPPPDGATLELGQVNQPSGKRITAWAIESDFDAASVHSNTFTIEWPRGSGELREFPEIDRAEWFDTEVVRHKLVKGQIPFIETLEKCLTEAADDER